METHSSILDSCLENPYGQRSLGCYSPLGRKESDMTERLGTAQHIHVCVHTIHTHTQICAPERIVSTEICPFFKL